MKLLFFFFFFSSRRRHTRYWRDWSSDVCSSDLLAKEVATLNLLTGGRYEIGIGTGWPAASPTGRADSLATGLDFGENGPRVSKLVEALHIIKTYLTTKEPFDFE